MSIDVPLLSGYLSAEVAAAELHVHPRTLKRWKTQHYGPTAVHIGKRVYYRRADIASWLTNLGQSNKARGSRPRKQAFSEPNRIKKDVEADQGILNPA